MHAMMAKRKEKAKETKGGSNGYHRTPAFIHAVLLDAQTALACQLSGNKGTPALTSHSMPKGGFTDVGQHTGTTPPSTAWPVVREALKVCFWDDCIQTMLFPCHDDWEIEYEPSRLTHGCIQTMLLPCHDRAMHV